MKSIRSIKLLYLKQKNFGWKKILPAIFFLGFRKAKPTINCEFIAIVVAVTNQKTRSLSGCGQARPVGRCQLPNAAIDNACQLPVRCRAQAVALADSASPARGRQNFSSPTRHTWANCCEGTCIGGRTVMRARDYTDKQMRESCNPNNTLGVVVDGDIRSVWFLPSARKHRNHNQND